MADLIEHCGVVERTERDTVYVRITSRSACGTCKARQACGLAEAQDKIVAVATPEAGQYAAGREVMVGVRRSAGVRAVVLDRYLLTVYQAIGSQFENVIYNNCFCIIV